MAEEAVGAPQEPAEIMGSLVLKNDLAQSSSLYLRSHKDNPVAWQEWNSKTIDLASKHQRLIFLSVGYNACHWCHVMERESFSSPEVAEILNTHFIPIKLDRESRPDIDDIYMNYVTATTGSGGWPLNVFLTPQLQPLFGGTYWPGPSSGTTIPADSEEKALTFLDVLRKLQEIWQNEKERCLQSAADITRQLQAFAAEGIYAHNSVQVRGAEENDPLEPLDLDLLDDALNHFVAKYDSRYGGFSQSPNSPKFLTATNITFLLRIGASITRPSTLTRFGFPTPIPAILGKKSCTSAASMALHTLLSVSRSALRDQLGHGFHRYSVTQDWNLPHFEKMTSDNAQLLSVYCDAWALDRDPEILGTIYDLVEYFTDPASPVVSKDGGWYSSEDADSTPEPTTSSAVAGHNEKKEGAFYVWTMREFIDILGDHDAQILAKHFGVKEHGNIPSSYDVNDDFLSQNTLFVDATPSVLAKEFGLKETEIVKIIKDGKLRLVDYRQKKRGKPAVDDKIILSWNALVISALARAANTLSTIDEGRANRCRDAAVKAVAFIKENLFSAKTGRLTRIYGSISHSSSDILDKDTAFIDDYAYFIQALIKVYDITIDRSYLHFAFSLQEILDKSFHAGLHGGYFQAAKSELADDRGIRSPSSASPVPFDNESQKIITKAEATSVQAALEQKSQDERKQIRLADQILNLKPGTDNSLPSPNGVIAQNLLYLASFASSFDTLPSTISSSDLTSSTQVSQPNLSSELSSTSTFTSTFTSTSTSILDATALQFRAKKTIDAFAPEIIQHPFLYVTLLGAVVLDAVGIKSLLAPSSISDAEIESRGLRGFGRTVVRLPQSDIGVGSGIKDGEVMICTKGVCRLLQHGELDDLGEYIDEDDTEVKEQNQGSQEAQAPQTQLEPETSTSILTQTQTKADEVTVAAEATNLDAETQILADQAQNHVRDATDATDNVSTKVINKTATSSSSLT